MVRDQSVDFMADKHGEVELSRLNLLLRHLYIFVFHANITTLGSNQAPNSHGIVNFENATI